ncbi:MAG: zinc ribbon domain-containing protein [Deltaproteobacteria bacterium]
MALQAVLAAVLGLAVLWMILQPLARPGAPAPRALEPLDPEETPRGVALTALKEIEFDRATGKLSDADYEELKARYTTAALAALRTESGAGGGSGPDDVEAMIAGRVRGLRSARASTPSAGPACPACGPRPEPDAVFCSSCGFRLEAPARCEHCGAELPEDSRFCESCGTRVAA